MLWGTLSFTMTMSWAGVLPFLLGLQVRTAKPWPSWARFKKPSSAIFPIWKTKSCQPLIPLIPSDRPGHMRWGLCPWKAAGLRSRSLGADPCSPLAALSHSISLILWSWQRSPVAWGTLWGHHRSWCSGRTGSSGTQPFQRWFFFFLPFFPKPAKSFKLWLRLLKESLTLYALCRVLKTQVLKWIWYQNSDCP